LHTSNFAIAEKDNLSRKHLRKHTDFGKVVADSNNDGLGESHPLINPREPVPP
jgi:hypothetical protein